MSHTGQVEGGWEALDLDSSPMPRVSLSVLPLWLLGGNLLRTSAGGIRLLFVPSLLLLFPLFLVLGGGGLHPEDAMLTGERGSSH